MAENISVQSATDGGDGGAAVAAVEFRSAGYCVLCNRMVEYGSGGGCVEGHPPAAIAGKVLLDDNEAVPVLGRFNLAAFLIPPLWGPLHGQWAGAVFLPMWLFADSIVGSAMGGGAGMVAGAAFVLIMTLAAQAWFASHANGLAWRAASTTVGPQAFVARQKAWAIAAVPTSALLLGWAVWYRFFYV